MPRMNDVDFENFWKEAENKLKEWQSINTSTFSQFTNTGINYQFPGYTYSTTDIKYHNTIDFKPNLFNFMGQAPFDRLFTGDTKDGAFFPCLLMA